MTFKEKYGPWALIIGGSEGIGLAFSKRLAARGLNVAITARKKAALEAAAAEIKAAGKIDVRILSQDITAPGMMDHIKAFTKDIEVGLVIYNAGALDRITTFLGDNIEGHLHTIRLNCEGPTRITHHFAGPMKERGRGGIILMSSAASQGGTYGVPVYAASKAFDTILAEGLWAELRDLGISVLSSVIGITRTPSQNRLLGCDQPNADDPDDIARDTLDNLENGPTYYAKQIRPMLQSVRDIDRRKAVGTMADAAKAFNIPGMNTKPFDPKAVVQ
jgi:short-subunit dehydrogenase